RAARQDVVAAGFDCHLAPVSHVEVPEGVTGLVVFAESGDDLQTDGLAALGSRVAASGAAAGRGAVARRRGEETTPPVVPPVLGDALDPREAPELLAVVDLRGLLVGAEHWRAVVGEPVPWDGPARAATRVLLAAPSLACTADLVVVTDESGEVDLPVEQRRRHRPDRCAATCRGVVAAAEELPARLRAGHAAALAAGSLGPLVVDALAGRAQAIGDVAALARVLVTHLGEDAGIARLAVEDRLRTWVVGHGDLGEVRSAVAFLAEHPRGLPTAGGPDGVVRQDAGGPDGGWLDAVPTPWRALGPADRRLRVRLLEPRSQAGTWELDGNALVTSLPGGSPVVRVDGVEARVTPRADPSAEVWAARDHEDHGDCGFRAVVPVDDLPPRPDGTRQVTVSLVGLSTTQSPPSPATARVPDAGAVPEVVVTGVRLDGGLLHLEGRGPAAELRLRGPRARTDWSPAATRPDGTFDVALALRTTLFSHVVALPGDQYVLETRDRGRPTPTLTWAPEIARPETEWVGDRLSLRPRAPDRIVVGPPVRLVDDSARARRRRMNAWTPSGTAALRRTVVLESFAGRAVADNPLAVGRELARRGLDLDLAWIVDDPSVQVPDGTRAVPRRTPEMFEALADAAVYVSNASAPAWWRKRPGMVHVQTWHGIPLKRIGEDRGPGDFATWRHREVVAAQSAGWDLLVSPSPWCTPIFRSAFRFGGTLLEAGQPRNDVLLGPTRDQVAARVRAELGLGAKDHVVLYAPTWRDHAGHREAKPVHLDVPAFLGAMPGTTLLVRGHYNATRQRDLSPGGRVVDVTRYPDVADLLCAADALVTDYSSVMFDFCLTDRPIVLLVPDLATYRDVHPGTYFDLEAQAPGPVVADTASVISALQAADGYHPARAAFRTEFCPLDDGNAAARVVDHLMDLVTW
ncbi:MAG: CDP-glycerol:glycerophosphate glycerophosphotransferase, partial [Marmoricola sp.]|nr:CDP-glycerol:glycerophosphate glycerophosphotransferase [Marmoricola sp.]